MRGVKLEDYLVGIMFSWVYFVAWRPSLIIRPLREKLRGKESLGFNITYGGEQ